MWVIGFSCRLSEFFDRRYLFVKRDCHMPSVFSRFINHFANRHLFWSCKSIIPRPPCSFGRHKISHLASLYLCLSVVPFQKNLDLKWSRFLSTPLGISKKDIMNMGRLLKIELSRTNIPPYDKYFAFQQESFYWNRSSTFLHSEFRSCLWCIGIPRYLKG